MRGHSKIDDVRRDVSCDQWIVLQGVDAYPGVSPARETMRANNLHKCRTACLAQGCGGFAIFRGVCYFRAAAANDLLDIAEHRVGGCLHICAPSTLCQPELFNDDVELRECQSRFVPADENNMMWRSLRSPLLENIPLKLSSRILQVGLLRRLRLDPYRGLDVKEVTGILDNLVAELGRTAHQLEYRREELCSLAEDACIAVPVSDVCTVLQETEGTIRELQKATIAWKSKVENALLASSFFAPGVSFGQLANFLEKVLTAEDGVGRKIKLADAVKVCAMEEIRKSFPCSISPAIADIEIQPSVVHEIPAVPQEWVGAIGFLASTLAFCTCPRFLSKALQVLRALVDFDVRVISAFRMLPGAQRALYRLQSAHHFGLVCSVEHIEVQSSAAALEKICFACTTVDEELSEQFPIGATYKAADRLRLTEDAALDSHCVCEVAPGSLCKVLAHAVNNGLGYVLVDWSRDIGWTSCKIKGRSLLNQEWNCAAYIAGLQEPLISPSEIRAKSSVARWRLW